MIHWCKTQAGTCLAPLPPIPNEMEQENPPPQPSEEERIGQAREEKLGTLMMRELEENENKWINYEDEDTQVKFDLADMVLEELTGELIDILANIKSN